jgi:hypothetical protein
MAAVAAPGEAAALRAGAAAADEDADFDLAGTPIARAGSLPVSSPRPRPPTLSASPAATHPLRHGSGAGAEQPP